MPSIPSHAVVALAIGTVFPRKQITGKMLLLGMLCGMFPDFDTIGMWLGIPYESTFGHRGFMHSILFAIVLSLLLATIVRNKKTPNNYRTLWFYFFLATLSHPLLDAMTSGGLGVAFFSPFSNERYFFPFRPIKVSHIGLSSFIKHNGIGVLKNEFVWLWVPSLVAMGIRCLVNNILSSRRKIV